MISSLADLKNVARGDGFVARAAFGVQKLENLLERLSVRGVAEKRALAAHEDKIFGFELVEVMGERGVRDIELRLNFADDQAFGMGGEQELHDAEAGFGAHGGEHVSEFGDLFSVLFGCRSGRHISIIAEIWLAVNRNARATLKAV
jgi:hypothetical protein